MRRALLLGLAACAAPAPPAAAPPAPPEIVVVDAAHVEARRDAQVIWAVAADEQGLTRTGEGAFHAPLRFYPASPRAQGTSEEKTRPRVLAARADGVVLTGARDGSVVAFSGAGSPLFQVGVRGAVISLAVRPDGDFSVETANGTAVITAGGAVREDETVGPRAEDRSLAYRPRRARPVDGAPFPVVRSILVRARDDVWALAGDPWEGLPWDLPTGQHLYHGGAGAFVDLGAPTLRLPRSLAEKSDPFFRPTDLDRGPRGEVLVVGSRAFWGEVEGSLVCGPAHPSLLERKGERLVERRELAAAAARLEGGGDREARHAVSASGKREIACLREACFARGITGPGFTRMDGVADDTKVAFAGETLWLAGRDGVRRDGVKISAARGEREVWIGAVQPDAVLRWDGARLVWLPTPASTARAIWASGPDDVWIAGGEHFDGARWSRIAGLEDTWLVAGAGRDDAWIGGASGLFHVTPDPDGGPARRGELVPAPPAMVSRPLAAPIDPALRLERVVIEIDGAPPLRGALSLAAGPGGLLWLHDGHRVIELAQGRARVLHVAPPLDPLAVGRGLAPTGPGEGAILARELRVLHAARVGEELLGLHQLTAVSRAPSGALWVVSAAGEVATRAPRDAHLLGGMPAGTYADVSARADDEVWFAGGLDGGHDHVRAWPEGEGSLVRFDGAYFTRFRGPDGGLLAVAAAGPGEAWAVGQGGSVIHVKAGAAEARSLEGGRALRAVAVGAPGEVWIGGDGSTVMRIDARGARRVDPAALGLDAAITAILPPGAGAGWAVGPSGIWRIHAR